MPDSGLAKSAGRHCPQAFHAARATEPLRTLGNPLPTRIQSTFPSFADLNFTTARYSCYKPPSSATEPDPEQSQKCRTQTLP